MTDNNQTVNQFPSNENSENPVAQQNTRPVDNIVSTIIQHKKLVIFFVIGILFFTSIIFMLLSSTQPSKTPNPTNIQPTAANEVIPTQVQPSNETSIVPTDTGISGEATPTPNESKEAVEIKTQVKSQIENTVAGPYEISRVKIYQNTWSLIQLYMPSAGKANVVLKKENGLWKVVLGPGSSFENEDLTKVGAPQALIQDANGVAF